MLAKTPFIFSVLFYQHWSSHFQVVLIPDHRVRIFIVFGYNNKNCKNYGFLKEKKERGKKKGLWKIQKKNINKWVWKVFPTG